MDNTKAEMDEWLQMFVDAGYGGAASSESGPNDAKGGSSDDACKDAIVLVEEDEFSDSNVPIITTLMASFNVGCQICLSKVAFAIRNAEYRPKSHSLGVVIRLRSPRSIVRVTSSGRCSVNGVKTVEDARMAAKYLTKLLTKLGYREATCSQFHIDSVHAVAKVDFPIRLEALAYEHKSFCIYEPEIHAGLIYRLHSPQLTFRIYVSGKIIIDGGKTEKDIFDGFDIIRTLVKDFRI
eukprot:GEMP01084572.1.p1 GENE.GEMP01084572.1~~GEMP01084572.1.p1  ORF type:complete len:237 (+),score=54.32 GEMP01084572.1:103-813(+)